MGVQDKIFDVTEALRKHGDQEAYDDFQELMDRYADMEKTVLEQGQALRTIKEAMGVLGSLLGVKQR